MGVLEARDTPPDTPSAVSTGYASGHTINPDRRTAGRSVGTRRGIHADTAPQSSGDALCPPKGDTRSQDRNRGLDWVQRIKARPPCPKCSSTRVLVGPFYDKFAFRCLQCGATWNGSPQ